MYYLYIILMADNKKDKSSGIGMIVGAVIFLGIAIALWVGMYNVKDKNLPVVMFWVGVVFAFAAIPLFIYGPQALK
jgi:hypothetical protein